MSDPHILDVLEAAWRAFEQRRFAAVVSHLERAPNGGGMLGTGLLLAATALVLERQGLIEEAERLMARVVALAVPIPEVQSEAASFLIRHGQPELAHHAFLMADVLAPESPRGEPLKAIPEAERARYAPSAIRAALRVQRPDAYAIADQKAELEKQLGPEGAAIAVSAMRAPGRAWPRNMVRRHKIESLADYAREHGIDYEEVIPATDVTNTMPQVLGKPRSGTFRGRSRSLFTCVLEDVIAVGRSNLLLTDEGLLMDTQTDELGRYELNLRVDSVVASTQDGTVLTIGPRNLDRIRRVPEGIWLVGVHSPEFGHWLLEFLPKVLALMGRPGFDDVPFIVDDRRRPQLMEVLRLLLGRRPRIIELELGEHVRVGRLWVGAQLLYMPAIDLETEKRRSDFAIDGEAFARLWGRASRRLEAIEAIDGYERVYLPRRPWQRGVMVNTEEIEPILEAAGFVRFDPWDETIAQQLSVIRSARYLVAQQGSAQYLLLFARPGLHVGLLNNTHLEGFQLDTALCDALGHSLVVATGDITRKDPDEPGYSDYRIKPSDLRALLAAMGAT